MWVWSLGQVGPLEKEMATHSSTLAWKIPWTEEPGRLHSMGSQRVKHNWSDLACTHSIILNISLNWKWKSESEVAQSCWLFVTLWNVAYQAPLSMGFSRQEYWSGLPFPSPDLPNPGIELWSPPSQADTLPSEPPGKPILKLRVFFYDQQSRIAVILDILYLPNMPDSLICWCSENRKGKMYDLH